MHEMDQHGTAGRSPGVFIGRSKLSGASVVTPQHTSTHPVHGQGSGIVMAEILIVEDDTDACELMDRYLRGAGHSVACASNGREALASMMDKRPDLVLLDVKLP